MNRSCQYKGSPAVRIVNSCGNDGRKMGKAAAESAAFPIAVESGSEQDAQADRGREVVQPAIAPTTSIRSDHLLGETG